MEKEDQIDSGEPNQVELELIELFAEIDGNGWLNKVTQDVQSSCS